MSKTSEQIEEILTSLIVVHPWIKPFNQDCEFAHCTIELLSYRRSEHPGFIDPYDVLATKPTVPELFVVKELEEFKDSIELYVKEHPAPPHWHTDDGSWFLFPTTTPTSIYSIACALGVEIRRQKTKEAEAAMRDIFIKNAETTAVDIGKRILTYSGRPIEELEAIKTLFEEYAKLNPSQLTDEILSVWAEKMSIAIRRRPT